MQEFWDQLAVLNPPEVIVAASVLMGVQSLWYSQHLFRKSWIRLSGIRPNDLRKKDKQRGHLVSAATALLTAMLLGLLAAHADGSLPMLLGATFFVALFVMMEQLNYVLWQKQPFALFVLQAGRALASLLACAAVFHFWN